MSAGQQLLDIANGAWREKRQEYRGFNYNLAVTKAKSQIGRTRGGRKDRQAEAEHTVTVMFNHARAQSAARLSAIADDAAATLSGTVALSADSELVSFATEVAGLLNGVHSGEFGVIDPAMIIGLIQAIIAAVQACKPKPTPVAP